MARLVIARPAEEHPQVLPRRAETPTGSSSGVPPGSPGPASGCHGQPTPVSHAEHRLSQVFAAMPRSVQRVPASTLMKSSVLGCLQLTHHPPSV